MRVWDDEWWRLCRRRRRGGGWRAAASGGQMFTDRWRSLCFLIRSRSSWLTKDCMIPFSALTVRRLIIPTNQLIFRWCLFDPDVISPHNNGTHGFLFGTPVIFNGFKPCSYGNSLLFKGFFSSLSLSLNGCCSSSHSFFFYTHWCSNSPQAIQWWTVLISDVGQRRTVTPSVILAVKNDNNTSSAS